MTVEEYNELFTHVKNMTDEEREAWIEENGGELEAAGSIDVE